MGTTTLAAGLGTSQIGGIRPIDSPENLEIIQDAIAAMIAGGTHTSVTISYDDVNGTLSFVAAGGGGGGSGGDVFGPASSVDGELVLFNGATGKQITRANALTGFMSIAVGVVSALTAGQFKTALSLVKGDVGLGNVDNISDFNKPISTATQNALDQKLSLSGGAMGGAITLAGPAVNPLEPVTKQQWDDAKEGMHSKGAARMRTIAALPTCTYSNGISGAGATLTANANGALTVDSLAAAAGDIIAVGDQAAQAQNGLYVCTQAGSGGTPWILTRAVTMDKNSEFAGAFVFVDFGTHAGRIQYSTATSSFVVGTTAYTWSASNSTLGSTDALPEGSTNLYFTANRVLATVLAGLNLTINAAITTSDSVLSAMGKLQKQITDALTTLALKANAANPTLTGLVTADGATVTPINTIGAFVIDTTKAANAKTISADQSFTFSADPVTAGHWFGLLLVNSDTGAPHQMTVPSAFDVSAQALKTKLTIAAGGKLNLLWMWHGGGYNLYGAPPDGANVLPVFPAADDTYAGTALSGRNAGATLTQWQAVYLDASFTWQLADANGSGTYPSQGLVVADAASAAPAVVLVNGPVRNDAWAWSAGPIYLSTTAGGLTQTRPSATGDKIQVIGYATSADSMMVCPSTEYLTAA